MTTERACAHEARKGAVPRLALTIQEAAQSLGVSRDHFERHVQPRIKTINIGRRRLVPVKELDRYLDRLTAKVL